jgi:hypothetical protein
MGDKGKCALARNCGFWPWAKIRNKGFCSSWRDGHRQHKQYLTEVESARANYRFWPKAEIGNEEIWGFEPRPWGFDGEWQPERGRTKLRA